MKYVAYTDGSYVSVRGHEIYSGAAIVAPEGTSDWKVLSKTCDDEYVAHRNVAGEIFAVIMTLEYLLKQGDCEEVTIYHDYTGIGMWAEGKWRANKELPKLYVTYLRTNVFPKMKVHFVWVKGHNGNDGNEIVDSVCSDAIEEYIKKKGF